MSSNLNLIFNEFNFNVTNHSERITYVFEDFRLKAAHRMLYRGEEELSLPPKAVETLLALVKRRGEIVGKDELMKMIWAEVAVEDSNLAHYLHVLRKTLGDRRDGKPFIETLRRRGYRFDAEVLVLEEPGENQNQPETAPENNETAFFSDAPPEDKSVSATDFQNPQFPYSQTFSKPIYHSRPNWTLFFAALTFAGVFVLTSFLYFQFQAVKKTSAVLRNELNITTLTNGNPVYSATISPDGRYFVYHELDGKKTNLWLQQTGQPTRVEILPPAERYISGKTFSPNGEFVYFLALEKDDLQNTLYRVPTLGGAVTKILTGIDSPVSFSPTGDEIAFMRHDKTGNQFLLVTAAADGSGEKIVLTRSGNEAISSGADWSPDGKSIAFGALTRNSPNGEGVFTLAALDLQSGAVKEISQEKWDTCFRLIWTKDGEGIIFVGTRAGESYTTRRDQIYYVSVQTGESHRVTTDGSRYQDLSLGVTNDNSIIAVPHKNLSQIWAVGANGDSRTALKLTNGQSDGKAGIAPLPDGRVGYLARIGENLSIWTMNADGSDQKQIFNELEFIEELRATPDGRYFIFSARRDGFSHLYRVDTDGKNLKQLTKGESYEIDSTISPDGKWIFHSSAFFDGSWRAEMRKTSIEGDASITLRDLAGSLFVPHFSPDGKYLSNHDNKNFTIISPDDGSVVKSFEAVPGAFFNLGSRWSPDGKSLTYIATQKHVSNIWQQPLAGGESQPLTDFTSGDINNYAFSSDGSKIYIARGYQISNAVLIKNFK